MRNEEEPKEEKEKLEEELMTFDAPVKKLRKKPNLTDKRKKQNDD